MVDAAAMVMATPAIQTNLHLVPWREVADLLGIKQRTFWRVCHELGIPRYQFNKRTVRFDLDQVKKWLAERRVGDWGDCA